MNVDEYLSDFRAHHSLDEITSWLDKISKLHPVVVGDAILDQYIFCKTLGVSSKDPVLAVLQQSVETYSGGALAVANHLGGLCDEVRLVTQLGEIERQEDFIASALRSNVLACFLTKGGAPTIVKRRYIDRYTSARLLEVYRMDDSLSDNAATARSALNDALAWGDLVLVADFGHGFMIDRIVSRIWASGVWLAVTAQSNSGNRGFNPISKYRRADYICMANHEADLECRRRDGDDREKLLEITKRIAAPKFTVTRGNLGTLHYDVLTETFYECPSLATKIVDRVGAGDSVFAVTSLLARVSCPWEILAFVGNVAGAVQVEVLGNAKTIDRKTLEARIIELLKG